MSVDDAVAASTEAPTRGSRPRRRTVVVLVACLALVIAGGAFALYVLALRSDPQASTTYRTTTVESQTLKQTVSATGTIAPARQADLSFSSSSSSSSRGGTVAEVDVAVGDTVAKGDTLARLDDDELQIDVDAAQAELDAARQSASDLADDDAATDTQIASATATVKVKQSALEQAEAALDDATMTAPFAGRIATVSLVAGDVIGSTGQSASSAQGTSGASGSSKAITLISADRYVVDTSVSVADVSKIKKGLQATITPTGATDPVFGTVSGVDVVAATSSSAQTGSTSGSATFGVEIKITGKQTGLLPGSSAAVAITVKQLNDVLAVPTAAISSNDNQTVVQKLVDGRQVATAVTTGAVIGNATVITEGLQAGDQIVVASFAVRQGTGNQNGQTGQNGGFGPGGPGGQGGPPDGVPPGGAGGGGNAPR